MLKRKCGLSLPLMAASSAPHQCRLCLRPSPARRDAHAAHTTRRRNRTPARCRRTPPRRCATGLAARKSLLHGRAPKNQLDSAKSSSCQSDTKASAPIACAASRADGRPFTPLQPADPGQREHAEQHRWHQVPSCLVGRFPKPPRATDPVGPGDRIKHPAEQAEARVAEPQARVALARTGCKFDRRRSGCRHMAIVGGAACLSW